MVAADFQRKMITPWQLVACKNALWWFLPCLTMMNKKELVLALLDCYE